MTTGVLTEAQFQKWLSDAFKEGNNWRAEIKKRCGDNKYMRGIDPKKHKEVKIMFHKELIERLAQRVKNLESGREEVVSRLNDLKEAAYFEYYQDWGIFYNDSKTISASKAIEKILDYLKLEFKCEEAKEADCSLISTVPKKPKKKVKIKAKKKK